MKLIDVPCATCEATVKAHDAAMALREGWVGGLKPLPDDYWRSGWRWCSGHNANYCPACQVNHECFEAVHAKHSVVVGDAVRFRDQVLREVSIETSVEGVKTLVLEPVD